MYTLPVPLFAWPFQSLRALLKASATGFVVLYKTSQIKIALAFMQIMQVTVRSSLKVKKVQVKLDEVLMSKSCGAYFRTSQ